MPETLVVTSDIEVRWEAISAEGWQQTCCLYAYLWPHAAKIAQLGMTWKGSVRERWLFDAKPDFWRWYSKTSDQHEVLVGTPILPKNQRLSKQLLADIESLLIIALQPEGNIQSISSRISRPGMRVSCTGLWPIRQNQFFDAG